jgi:hypothetical protein
MTSAAPRYTSLSYTAFLWMHFFQRAWLMDITFPVRPSPLTCRLRQPRLAQAKARCIARAPATVANRASPHKIQDRFPPTLLLCPRSCCSSACTAASPLRDHAS